MSAENMKVRRITLYRDDSTTPVVYERVKHFWYENGGRVLVIAYLVGTSGAHDYVHWPVKRFTWFRDEKVGHAEANQDEPSLTRSALVEFRAPRIPGGSTVDIVETPQGTFRADQFFVDSTTAEFFTVSDIRVGKTSPVDFLKPISAALFKGGRSMKFQTCQAGQNLTVTVSNVDDKNPHDFVGMLVGRTGEEDKHI